MKSRLPPGARRVSENAPAAPGGNPPVTAPARHGSCPECGFSESELYPRIFSFNTEQGRCARCEGNGVVALAPPKKKRARRWRTGREKPEGKELDRSQPLQVCPSCQGSRLAPVPRAVRLYGERYADVCR